MNSLGVDLDSFPLNYSDAYAAIEIFGEAQNSIDACLSPERFNCHMIDYMYTYLTSNAFNCGMKIWAREMWYRYRLKMCLLGKTSRKMPGFIEDFKRIHSLEKKIDIQN